MRNRWPGATAQPAAASRRSGTLRISMLPITSAADTGLPLAVNAVLETEGPEQIARDVAGNHAQRLGLPDPDLAQHVRRAPDRVVAVRLLTTGSGTFVDHSAGAMAASTPALPPSAPPFSAAVGETR